MSVVRRGSVAGVVVAGAVLLGGPAWAQEDPCAPGPDGAVPEMCQSGPAGPGSDTGTVGIPPDQPVDDGGSGSPCTSVSPDGGVPVDGGVAVGEPGPGSGPDEPVSNEPVSSEPSALADDTVICASGVPLGAPEVTGGGGTQVDAAAAELPRTGSTERLLALTVVGAGLVVLGAGATAAGRRRRT